VEELIKKEKDRAEMGSAVHDAHRSDGFNKGKEEAWYSELITKLINAGWGK